MLEVNLIHVVVIASVTLIINGASVTESYTYSNAVATTPTILNSTSLLRRRTARGMDTAVAVTNQQDDSEKAIKNDPWQGYYEFLINEGSFKFWAVFEVVTAAILIYSAFAAVYYAKYNFIQADYDYGDYFLGRSNDDISSNNDWFGLNSQTFQRILDAISSKKYS